MSYIYLLIAILSEVMATSMLKASNGFTKFIPSSIAVLGFVVALFLLSLSIKTIPIGIAYGIWSGVGIVLTTIIAWIIHNQKPDIWMMVGIAFIVAGVIIANTLSKVSAH
jgi:multidrug transporter EmrE-like cation transporter